MCPTRLILATAAAAATLAVAAAPALGGSVSLRTFVIAEPKSTPFDAATTTWTAAPGEANRLTAVFDARTAEIVLRDAGAPLVPGEGCRALPDGAVSCAPPARMGNALVLDAGDGDDALVLQAPEGGTSYVRLGDGNDRLATGGTYASAQGGAGADVMLGGDRNDSLIGGAGPDELRGGAGDDWLTGDGPDSAPAADLLDGGPGDRDHVGYEERTEGVAVDLVAGTGGAAGEGDRLVGVEDVTGGRGADVLRGDDAANELDGSSGHRADVIEGRGGDDDLDGTGPGPGGPGTLRMTGGEGDDRLLAYGRVDLDAGPGADYLWGHGVGPFRCGSGRDLVRPRRGAVVARDCERIETWLFDLTRLRPGADRLGVTLRATGYPRGEMCGAELLLRARGRTLAHRLVRVPNRRERRVQLAPFGGLPATARVVVGYLSCFGRRPPVVDREARESFRVALR